MKHQGMLLENGNDYIDWCLTIKLRENWCSHHSLFMTSITWWHAYTLSYTLFYIVFSNRFCHLYLFARHTQYFLIHTCSALAELHTEVNYHFPLHFKTRIPAPQLHVSYALDLFCQYHQHSNGITRHLVETESSKLFTSHRWYISHQGR